MPTEQPAPLAWLSRTDLLHCRPDLASQINQLEDSDIDYLAEKVGDSLQESYWIALEILIMEYLGVGDSEEEDAMD